MKRIYLILIIMGAAVLSAQSVWTGNAAVSSEREFESYYSENSSDGKFLGASNSFPGSTEVTVTNPRNGKSISVLIVKRLSQPGLFLVLSPEAGQAIALPNDDILNVEVVVRRKNEEVFNKYTDDKPYSDDPDLNPSAELAVNSVGDESSGSSENPVPASSVEETESEPELEAPVETSVNEYIPPVVLNNDGTPYDEGYNPLILLESDKENSSEPEEIVEIIDDPRVLMDAITSTVAEPDIPLPERYVESDLPETYDTYDREGEISGTVVDDVSALTLVPAEPGVLKPEDLDPEFMDADINDLLLSDSVEVAVSEPIIEETIIPETVESDVALISPEEEMELIVIEPEVSEPIVVIPETIVEPPGTVIYFLTPGDFRPPPQSEEKKEKEKEKVKEKKIVPIPVERSKLEELIVTELHNGGSYLQVGTYSSVDILYSQIEQISDSYPSIVLTMGERENQLYKLLIGPISRDEKGVVMTRFRSSGFNDAFLYSPR